jgi:hypothetical protein
MCDVTNAKGKIAWNGCWVNDEPGGAGAQQDPHYPA